MSCKIYSIFVYNYKNHFFYLYIILSDLFPPVVVLCLMIAAAVHAQNTPNICTGLAINTSVRDVANCARYFECVNGIPMARECLFGTLFDPLAQECTYRHVECFQCPHEHYFVDLAVERQCMQFVRCFAGSAVQRTCANGLWFDRDRGQCNVAQNFVCF